MGEVTCFRRRKDEPELGPVIPRILDQTGQATKPNKHRLPSQRSLFTKSPAVNMAGGPQTVSQPILKMSTWGWQSCSELPRDIQPGGRNLDVEFKMEGRSKTGETP